MNGVVATTTPAPCDCQVPDVLAALSGPALDAAMWRRLYSAEEAAAAVARCTIVSYGEKLDAMGSARITAHPSGYGIGAANWVVQVSLV
jgi:Cft2 family RNA processing exonuclease